MVRRMLRSRSKKRTMKKTPGRRLKIHYSRKQTSKSRCHSCDKVLHGKKKTGPKTNRRASRIMPELCASCLKKQLIKKVRDQK